MTAAALEKSHATSGSRPGCPSQSRPVDLVHLATQTMGDKALEIEVLRMFLGQARRALHDMIDADAEKTAFVAHRLKGSAGAVGAFQLVAAAEKLERASGDASLKAAVTSAVVEVEEFIDTLCR